MGVSDSGSRTGQSSMMAPAKKNYYDQPTTPMVPSYLGKAGHTTPMVPSNPQPYNPAAMSSLSGQMLGRQFDAPQAQQAPQALPQSRIPGRAPMLSAAPAAYQSALVTRRPSDAGYVFNNAPTPLAVRNAPMAQFQPSPEMQGLMNQGGIGMPGMNSGISLGLGQAPMLQPGQPQQHQWGRGMSNLPPHLLY